MSRILTNRISTFAFVQHLNQSKFDVHKLLSNALCDKTFIIIVIGLIDNQIISNDGKMIKMKKNKRKINYSVIINQWFCAHFFNPFFFCNSTTSHTRRQLTLDLAFNYWTKLCQVCCGWILNFLAFLLFNAFSFQMRVKFHFISWFALFSLRISNPIKSNVKVMYCITLLYFLIQFIHDRKVSKMFELGKQQRISTKVAAWG